VHKHAPAFDIRGTAASADRQRRPEPNRLHWSASRAQIVSEIGTDMSRWPIAKHFTPQAHVGARQQSLRRTSAQLPDPALRRLALPR